MQVWPGQQSPLGATYDGSGTNFALFQSTAFGQNTQLFEVISREVRQPHMRLFVIIGGTRCLARLRFSHANILTGHGVGEAVIHRR